MWLEFSTDLEDGIVHDILRRLLVRTLARFKCVSKLWKSAISHPNFLQTQISVLFTTHYESRTIHEYDSGNEFDDRLKHIFLHYVENQSLMRSCILPRDKEPWISVYKSYYLWPDTYFITNSCHGLVVIGIKTSLYLFNPSTNFLIKVLQLDKLACHATRLGDPGYEVSGGFCYDDSTNDYKVVLILYDDDKSRGGNGYELVLVASLKLKSWSSIGLVGFRLLSVKMGPIVNGKLHFIARPSNSDRIQGAEIVYYFDPRSEIFEELSIPPPRRCEDKIFSLGGFNDQLVMCREVNIGNKEWGSIEVMVMKKYGVLESWTTLFVISDVVNFTKCPYSWNFTLFAKNGEVYIN